MNKKEYYSKKLSGIRLKKCYDIAPIRIKEYLLAEIEYLLKYIELTDIVLELGCGYGRILIELVDYARTIYGIDTSQGNLNLGENFIVNKSNIRLLNMNVEYLKFNNQFFDVVFALQNGISAFNIDPIRLIKESLRVTKTGGKVIFSSYSDKIWEERLNWFIHQSKENLIGEIDFNKTKDGSIVCKDGFKASTYTINDFEILKSKLDLNAIIKEVDSSSIFFIITK